MIDARERAKPERVPPSESEDLREGRYAASPAPIKSKGKAPDPFAAIVLPDEPEAKKSKRHPPRDEEDDEEESEEPK